MAKQIPAQKFESPCKKAVTIVENDMPLGSFHDYLLSLKGEMVDRMVKSQKEENEQSEIQKTMDSCQ